MKIAPDFLVAALHIPQKRAELWVPHIQSAMELAEINTPLRLAHFLGQVGHESGHLRYTREIWGPTSAQARYEPVTTLSKRLGNTKPGDGKRFMGRGLIQTTGRANYVHTNQRMKALVGESAPDIMTAPAILELPEWAAMSAAIYWRDRKLNDWADKDDIYTLTKRVNGGTNGLADRQAIYASARAAGDWQ